MQTKDPPRRGRSTGYGAEIAETICLRLIAGESLRAICGIALDGSRWVSCRSRFFLPWRVLAKLFRHGGHYRRRACRGEVRSADYRSRLKRRVVPTECIFCNVFDPRNGRPKS
jgi:hypothetical protein